MIRICITSFLISLSFFGLAQRQIYSDQTIISMFSQVGVVHNKGLDVVLNNLQRDYGSSYRGGNSQKERTILVQKADESVSDYMTTELQVRDIDIRQFIHHDVEAKTLLEKDLISAIGLFPEGRTFSAIFMDAMNELNNIMDNESTCQDQAAYNQIISAFIGRLSTYKEKAYLVSTVSTGYNSSVYWQNNFIRWKNFFAPGDKLKSLAYFKQVPTASFASWPTLGSKKKYFGWGRDVAKADVVGVVAGGISGCAYGAMGGTATFPGLGTVAGCVGVGMIGAVGGGISNSATAAISAFVDWLFG